MQLFVGLGNPESKYAKNRHNVGFMAIDALAAAYGFGDFREKYHGLLAEGQIGHEKVLLLKPQTFMNKSGVSVSEAVNFFKLDGSQIVVFYDELDLPPGKLRMRRGGGFAGAANAGHDKGLGNAVGFKGVFQRSHHGILAHQIGKQILLFKQHVAHHRQTAALESKAV